MPSSEFADLHHLLTNLATRERDALEAALLDAPDANADADAPTRAFEQPTVAVSAAASDANANSNSQSAGATHTRAQSCPPARSGSASALPESSAPDSKATGGSLRELPRAAPPTGDHKTSSRSDSDSDLKSGERRGEAVEAAAQMGAADDEEMQGDWDAEGHEPPFEASAASAETPAATDTKQCEKANGQLQDTIAPPLAADLHVEPQGDWAVDADIDDSAPGVGVEDDERESPTRKQTAHGGEASEPKSHPNSDEATAQNADALLAASKSTSANGSTQSTKPKALDAADVFPIDEIIQRSCIKFSSCRKLFIDMLIILVVIHP